ncbi:hypothetical protein F5144DRAFT_27263 [Chaetomium tenue]|uniref:Uncharacterized protein n=1 Tax=Chaetomium tenue TaxID=1854479 RepID=A0ACB7PRU3_9PEZI|nr:hypothetical protein F5144DRAFT_27263 [Chaetomium globosum]
MAQPPLSHPTELFWLWRPLCRGGLHIRKRKATLAMTSWRFSAIKAACYAAISARPVVPETDHPTEDKGPGRAPVAVSRRAFASGNSIFTMYICLCMLEKTARDKPARVGATRKRRFGSFPVVGQGGSYRYWVLDAQLIQCVCNVGQQISKVAYRACRKGKCQGP